MSLAPLGPNDRLRFIRDLQDAFVALHILSEGERVGGVVLVIDRMTHRNSLAFFFARPGGHGRGIGPRAWQLVEARFPETGSRETHTPNSEKRNIHFYVNKCGFRIVEFFNERHPDPHDEHARMTHRTPPRTCAR